MVVWKGKNYKMFPGQGSNTFTKFGDGSVEALVDSQADEVMALFQRVADAAAESPEEYRWPTRDESAAVPDPVDNAALIRELLFGKRAAEAAKSSRTRSETEDAWVIWRREENRRRLTGKPKLRM